MTQLALEGWHLDARQYRGPKATSTIGAMLMVFTFAFTLTGIGILIPAGVQKFHSTVTAYAVQFTILGIVGALAMPLIGRAARRWGVRLPAAIGSAWSAVWILAVSFSTELWQMILFTVLWSIGWSFGTLLPAALLINTWHRPQRRGFFQGLTASASGAGGVLAGLMLPSLIPIVGWSGVVQIIAATVLIGMTANALILVRNPPGLIVARGKAATEGDRPKISLHSQKLLLPFVVILIAAVVLSAEAGLTNIAVPIYASKGVTLVEAGILVSIFSLVQLPMGPLGGWIYDRFGVRGSMILLVAAYVIGFGGLIFASGFVALLIVLPFVGVALTNVLVMLPLYTQRVVGRTNFASSYGYVLMAYYLSASLVAPLWALGFDLTGSFNISLLGGIIAGVGGLGLVLVAVGLTRRSPAISAERDGVETDSTAAVVS
jgi:MFS family permease